MPTIPPRVPTQTQQPTPMPYQRSNAPALAFGIGGQGLSDLGQGMMQGGAALDRIAQDMDVSAVKTKLNDLDALARDLQYSTETDPSTGKPVGYMLRSGQDALDGYGATARALEEKTKELGASLSGRQQRMFGEVAQGTISQTLRSMSAHRAREQLTYLDQVSDASIANAAANAVTYYGMGEFEMNIAAGRAEIARKLRRNGVQDPTMLIQAGEAWESGVYTDVANRMLANRDVAGAAAFYKENASRFRGNDASKIEDRLEIAFERAERQNERELSRVQGVTYGRMFSKVVDGTLEKDEIDAALKNRTLSGENAVSLYRALRSPEPTRDDPAAVTQLYRDHDAGAAVGPRALDLYASGAITKGTLDHFRTMDERGDTPRVTQYRSYVRDQIGGARGPMAILDPDVSARESTAIREYNERVAGGEDPAQVADDVVPRYRIQPLSASAMGMPKYIGGGSKDNLADLERARQETARRFQSGEIKQPEAKREAELIRQLMEIAQRAQQQPQQPKKERR
ncbi:MAG: hypothetical protein RBR34_11030 [Rhodospirillaceae bacterium]|nr:hypothetical protein [Rhodospirillaceae bacterium]